ncbi:hypothetical protein [Symbiopectobacterium purcellii]
MQAIAHGTIGEITGFHGYFAPNRILTIIHATKPAESTSEFAVF